MLFDVELFIAKPLFLLIVKSFILRFSFVAQCKYLRFSSFFLSKFKFLPLDFPVSECKHVDL